MQFLLQYYFQMVLLQAKPQDCPSSQALQLSLLLLYFLVSVLTALVLYSLWQSIVHSILDLTLLYLFTQILLMNTKERIHQTFNAFLGAGILIGMVNAILSYALIEAGDVDSISDPDKILFFLVFIWTVVVYGHIVQHSLGVNLASGVGIILGYALISIIFLRTILVALGL